LRAAYLLSARVLDEVVAYLRQTQAADNQQRVQQTLIEAQLLHEHSAAGSLPVLQQGLAKLPNHPICSTKARCWRMDRQLVSNSRCAS
jgi:hypothetical protein